MGFPPHSNFERTDSPKIALTADKHSMGLSALSAHSVGRTAAVKAGGKPVDEESLLAYADLRARYYGGRTSEQTAGEP